MEFVLMDHHTGKDEEISFEDFVDVLKNWIVPNQWINIGLSNGDPELVFNYSLIVKVEV